MMVAIAITSCTQGNAFVGKWETPGAVAQALELDSDGSAHLYVARYGTMTPILETYRTISTNAINLDRTGLKFEMESDGSLKQLDVTKKNDSWALMGLRACPAGMTCPGDPAPTPVVLVRVQRFDFSSGN